MTYVSSAAEDPPDPTDEDACRGCGADLCTVCGYCSRYSCTCNGIPDDRWQEALDDATDGAVDDAKVREAEGS